MDRDGGKNDDDDDDDDVIFVHSFDAGFPFPVARDACPDTGRLGGRLCAPNAN